MILTYRQDGEADTGTDGDGDSLRIAETDPSADDTAPSTDRVGNEVQPR